MASALDSFIHSYQVGAAEQIEPLRAPWPSHLGSSRYLRTRACDNARLPQRKQITFPSCERFVTSFSTICSLHLRV